jgi:hypothetical protein
MNLENTKKLGQRTTHLYGLKRQILNWENISFLNHNSRKKPLFYMNIILTNFLDVYTIY